MSKRAIALLLALHTLIVWIAVPFRIDEFPLTWAPMYAIQATEARESRSVVLKDRGRLETEGWRAVRADGAEEWVRRADLNVSRRSMWRLYYERTWNGPPPRFRHKNSGAATLDRWWLGLPPGAPIFAANWQKLLLTSVNETLGRAPGDASFIVALHAERTRMHFEADSLERASDTHESVAAYWRPEWDGELAR